MKLLVIEDHAWVLNTLCQLFRCKGASVESATTVRAAKDRLLQDKPYDAVVCERTLSDGTAFELLGWMRWSRGNSIPFLLIARNEEVCQAIASGFSGFDLAGCANWFRRGLGDRLRHASKGMIACQIPFAGESD